MARSDQTNSDQPAGVHVCVPTERVTPRRDGSELGAGKGKRVTPTYLRDSS